MTRKLRNFMSPNNDDNVHRCIAPRGDPSVCTAIVCPRDVEYVVRSINKYQTQISRARPRIIVSSGRSMSWPLDEDRWEWVKITSDNSRWSLTKLTTRIVHVCSFQICRMNCDDADKTGNSTGNEANSSCILYIKQKLKRLIETEAFTSSSKD